MKRASRQDLITKSRSRFDVNELSVDEILERTVGLFHAWQFRIFILMALLKIPIAWFQLSIIFLAPPTTFWCKRPAEYSNMNTHEWLELITPNNTEKNMEKSSYLLHGSCKIRNPNTNNLIRCPWGYEYNTTAIHSSIITSFNLVCERRYLIDVSQAVFMLGVLVGCIVFGVASDRYGRKPMLIICLAIETISGLAITFTPNYWSFSFARFIAAIANGGIKIISFVICMEIVGSTWRAKVSILYQIPFGLGLSTMAVFAYYIRDWRQFQLTISLISGLYLIYWILVPESPRWLLVTNSTEKAIRELEKAAIINKKPVEAVRKTIRKVRFTNAERPTLLTLFRTQVLCKTSILLCIQWFIIGLSFYGISQYMSQISIDLYFVMGIGGLFVFPGALLCCVIVQKFGRRPAIISADVWTAICYIAIWAIPLGSYPHDWPRTLIAGFGIIGMSISLPAAYLFTGELFPTVLRNAGVGFSVMCSRIGSMIAPFIISLPELVPGLPLIILATLVLTKALLILPLPETKGTDLLDTMEDVEMFVISQRIAREQKRRGTYSMLQ